MNKWLDYLTKRREFHLPDVGLDWDFMSVASLTSLPTVVSLLYVFNIGGIKTDVQKNIQRENNSYKLELIAELAHRIERADGMKGISTEDKADFIKKTGGRYPIINCMVLNLRDGKPIDPSIIPESDLEMSLHSYNPKIKHNT